MRWMIVLSLIFYALPLYANEKPYQPICTVDANILTLDHGRFFYNGKDFYDYVEVGILKRSINVLQVGNDLAACSPVDEKDKTDLVRSWDWNKKGVLAYPDGTPVAQNDNVRLTLAAVYVGDKAWPSIIKIERLEVAIVDESKRELFSSQEIERMVFVLNTYHVAYKKVDSKLQISCALWKDQDIMANYTEKAKDDSWFTGAVK